MAAAAPAHRKLPFHSASQISPIVLTNANTGTMAGTTSAAPGHDEVPVLTPGEMVGTGQLERGLVGFRARVA